MTKDGSSVLAIIPARGGSRGIPNKNIVPLAGKPLIAWTIQAAQAVPVIDRIVVSSDSEEILEVSARWNAEPLKRPFELATDKADALQVINHAVQALRKTIDPDIVVYLQPTSPLRTSDDIVRALDIFVASDADSLISVFRIENKFLKSFLIDERGYLKGISNNEFPFMDRRSLPPLYMSNGAIYLFRQTFFASTQSLYSQKALPFEMPTERSIDIDTPADLRAAEIVLSA